MGEAEDAFWTGEYNYKSKRCAEWGMSQFQVASEKKHLYTDLSVSVWRHNYAMNHNASPLNREEATNEVDPREEAGARGDD